MKNTKYALSDIKIHLAGKTAWATFNYTISADVGEAGKTRHVESAGLGTAVLEKRDGQWCIGIRARHAALRHRRQVRAAKP